MAIVRCAYDKVSRILFADTAQAAARLHPICRTPSRAAWGGPALPCRTAASSTTTCATEAAAVSQRHEAATDLGQPFLATTGAKQLGEAGGDVGIEARFLPAQQCALLVETGTRFAHLRSSTSVSHEQLRGLFGPRRQ